MPLVRFIISPEHGEFKALSHEISPISLREFLLMTISWFLAELVLGEIIFLARQIGERHKEMRAGRWNKVSQSLIFKLSLDILYLR